MCLDITKSCSLTNQKFTLTIITCGIFLIFQQIRNWQKIPSHLRDQLSGTKWRPPLKITNHWLCLKHVWKSIFLINIELSEVYNNMYVSITWSFMVPYVMTVLYIVSHAVLLDLIFFLFLALSLIFILFLPSGTEPFIPGSLFAINWCSWTYLCAYVHTLCLLLRSNIVLVSLML